MVTAFASAPILNGASSTIATNGADSAKNSHSDVSETTFTPAIFERSAGNHHSQRDPPSAIVFLEPREHARQVGHEQRGINRHIENRRDQREPGFLKSPEIAHGAAHPSVIAALVGQRARKLADHERRRQAPEQRGEQQNQNRASVPGAVHDVFRAIGSARHHKEGGGDQWPQREAHELLRGNRVLGDRVPVGDAGERLGILCLMTRGASCCQFRCLPPQATHSQLLRSGLVPARAFWFGLDSRNSAEVSSH